MRKRNVSIELLRCLLMFGICMCHSVGAGGYIYEPLRNIFMMCTVGFIFITGWFGVRFSLKRVVTLIVTAIFAALIVMIEDYGLNRSFTRSFVSIISEWWFLNAYFFLLILSPVFNCIANCLCVEDKKIRRDAICACVIFAFIVYCLAWPMKCGWIPPVRFVTTWGFPAQFGNMCTIYLLARMVALCKVCDRVNSLSATLCVLIPIVTAFWGIKFTYYNSPFDFMFAFGLFCLFRKKLIVDESFLAKVILFVSPSLFFVYLYHSHPNPGFEILAKCQGFIVNIGVPIPFAWLLIAIFIFVVGIAVDSIRRMLFHFYRAVIKHDANG